MLIEVVRCRQIENDRLRRWFSSRSIDLFVWYENGELFGFQVCYDKHRHEHALTWRKDLGWSHKRVDDGHGSGSVKGSPFLRSNGGLSVTYVIDEFELNAQELEPKLLDFIMGKLPESREQLYC